VLGLDLTGISIEVCESIVKARPSRRSSMWRDWSLYWDAIHNQVPANDLGFLSPYSAYDSGSDCGGDMRSLLQAGCAAVHVPSKAGMLLRIPLTCLCA
jgi:hypothetical protein